jgi:hypothetical protein
VPAGRIRHAAHQAVLFSWDHHEVQKVFASPFILFARFSAETAQNVFLTELNNVAMHVTRPSVSPASNTHGPLAIGQNHETTSSIEWQRWTHNLPFSCAPNTRRDGRDCTDFRKSEDEGGLFEQVRRRTISILIQLGK